MSSTAPSPVPSAAARAAVDGACAPCTAARVSRRGALLAGGGVVLAGCAQDDPAPAATSTSAPPSSSSSSPGASGSSSGAAGGAALAQLADVPVGSAVAATSAAGRSVLVAQPSAGQVVAFDASCPHKGCVVVASGEELVCPCHNSRFELATGAVLNGPATSGLAPLPVRVEGGAVVEGA